MTAVAALDPTEGLPYPARRENEVAADAIWMLFKAGILTEKPTVLLAVVEATGLSVDDFRVASVRYDRRDGRRLEFSPERATRPPGPAQEPAERLTRPSPPAPLPPQVYDRQPIPRRGDLAPPDRPPVRLTDAGRRGAAEAIFAMWRARGNLDCTNCGKPIHSGSDAVIEAAHHEVCP